MIYPSSFENKIGFTAVRQQIAELCVSSNGRQWCKDMTFSTIFSAIDSALRATSEMLSIISGDDELHIDGVADIGETLKNARIPGTFIAAPELQRVGASLACIGDIVAFFSRNCDENGRNAYPALSEIASGLTVFPQVVRDIGSVLDRFGRIKDNASPELAEIRRRLSSMGGTANTAMRRVMARAVQEGVLDSDVSPTMRDGRLVIPVAPMHKRRINGIVHDESASGKTIFIEPAEVVEVNNRIRELQMEERREETRILTVVTDSLRPDIPDMLVSLDVVGHLDFIRAKSRYADRVGGCLPVMSDRPEMEWYRACHPVLLESLRRQGKEIVPLDITLSSPDARILVISGPNAGGKSVCLKTVGLLQYMVQCGVLPSLNDNSRMGVFTDIFVDIGDDQSIEDDLSTYSSHLSNMKLILGRGSEASLVLIDEFGGGTEPQIGGAIAQAILHRLNELNVWGVITTHYQNIKHFAEDTAGLINGSMLYDRRLMQPLFKLSIGHPGSSFALEIARNIGLPAKILNEAEEIVGSDYVNMDRYLLDIARDRRYWENKRTAIRQREKRIEEILEKYESDAETLRQHRREILEEARGEARRIIESSNAQVERTIHDIRRAQADREQTLEARRRLAEELKSMDSPVAATDSHPLLDKAPKPKKKKKESLRGGTEKPIQPGDVVKLDGEGTPGRVEEINGKNATVIFGMLRTQVKLDRLRPSGAKIDSGVSKKASFVSAATSDDLRDRQLEFNRDIDVRGMRVDEALQAVTYFIDDAIQFSAGRVRILHGTGTGALRQSIRQYLSTVKGVKSYRDEHVQFGGAGITVVDLE